MQHFTIAIFTITDVQHSMEEMTTKNITFYKKIVKVYHDKNITEMQHFIKIM